MEGNFQHEALKKCVAVICQSIGFQGIYSMPLEVLTDLLHRYLREIAVLTHRFAEHDNRTLPTLVDLSYTFNELKISLPELEEFVSSVESVPFPDAIPKLPVMRPSQLNLLKPGSREILSRPIHIHEHLPPMLPDKEEEDSKDGLLNGACAGDNSAPGSTDGPNAAEDQDGGDQSSQHHQGGGSPSHFSSLLAAAASKRSSDSEASAAKRFNGVDGEGEPVREIDSVIMTTSGFISSAREGKLPDARLPDIPLPTLPHTSSSRATGGGGRGGSSSTNGPHSAQTSATIKKKMSLERLMRHKHNIALKKKASTGPPFASGTPTGASLSHSSKSKSAKKSLSHSAVMSMAAGAAVDSNLCFTTKHGKSKDKLKPKIPATPPGTSRLPNPAAMSAENQQHFINSTCNISKRPNPLLTTPTGSLPPPKLKIPTPKMKQPEFSTDVLPLPKEDIQEQQERKLQIMKKEEKQKELARAAKNGMLGSFVGTENVDGNGVVSGAAGIGGRVLPPGTRVVLPGTRVALPGTRVALPGTRVALPGTRVAPSGVLSGTPLAGGAGQPPECGALPQALLSKIKKEKKEKEGKKELKKINKDDKKDKEKRDKEKRELKKEKILKKKEEKEKRDKDKKDEKKREREAKKMKEASKKDKDSKKMKEGKKSKDGKVKEKDPMKKEKKEMKKVKKVSPGSATPKSSHLKEPSNLSLGGVEQSQSILSSTSDSFLSRTPLSVAPLDTLTNPPMSTTTNTSEAMASPLSPDSGKSKLCIFKKNNKNPKEVLPHDFLDNKLESSGTLAFDSTSLLQGSVTSNSFVGGMDMSADLSGVISSPSIVETPKSSLEKAAKPRKRKKPDGSAGAKGIETLGSPKAKKPKKEKGIGVNSKSRFPKGAASNVPNLSIGTTNNPVELMDDNATPFATLGMLSGTPMSHWDSRPLTPGGHDTSPGIPNCPPTPGMHSLPPFGHVPLPPHASSFSPQNMCIDAFGRAPHGSDILERPLTPGGQFLHGRGGPPDLSFSNSPVTPTQGLGGGFLLPLSPGISDQSPATPALTPAGAAPPSLSAAPVACGGHSTPSLSASDTDKKKKEKEHRREKKDKDKIKKKKDKKDKGGKVEKKLKDKQKKEKKKKKGLVVAGASTAVEGRGEGPGTAPPTSESSPITEQQATPLPATPKIVIKRSEPSNPSSSVSSFSVSSSSNLAKEDQPGSPELAKISALITRPPKPSTSKDKSKSSSRGGSSSRDVVSSSSSVTAGPTPSSSSVALPPPPSVSVPSPSPAAMMVKCTDVVSLPTLKIREIKSASSVAAKEREYGGIRGSTSQESLDFSMGGLLHQQLQQQQHQVVPPLKIKQHSVPPTEDKAGLIKKTPPAVFGSTSPHRSSKPGRKPTSQLPASTPLPPAATSATSTAASLGHFVDDKGNEFWVCPSCGKQDDGSPMIGCDTCDDWYHWVCVGIQVPPNETENWYCPRCLAQHKQRSLLGAPGGKRDKKRHHHRKKK